MAQAWDMTVSRGRGRDLQALSYGQLAGRVTIYENRIDDSRRRP